MTDDTKDNSGGYCNPPVKHQFQKGRSGNPKGRPKGTKNLKTDFDEELNELVRVKEGGVQKTMTKQRAVVKNTIAKGMHGDLVAAGKVFEQINRFAGQDNNDEPLAEQDARLSQTDAQLMEDHNRRILRNAGVTQPEKDDEAVAVGPNENVRDPDSVGPNGNANIEDEQGDDDDWLN